jgi:hypothetical protein
MSLKRSRTPTSAPATAAWNARMVRTQSEREFLGLPWLSIAFGANPAKGERRGHARGVIAIGDVATGIIAIGGVARGVIALGGVACGVLAFGGLAIGAFALGGGALGGVAMGGGAAGIVAIGGAAFGYYAAGGAAFGAFAMSPLGKSPEAVEFFRSFAELWRDAPPR